MKTFLLAVTIWCIALSAQAAALLWDAQPLDGSLVIERGEGATGPFATVATVPQGTTQFVLTPGQWGFYRVRSSAGPSNVVQYSLDLYSGGLTDRLDALEARVTVLEQPVVAPPGISNFTVTVIDPDHIRLVCNGIGITTSGSGTSRILECRH